MRRYWQKTKNYKAMGLTSVFGDGKSWLGWKEYGGLVEAKNNFHSNQSDLKSLPSEGLGENRFGSCCQVTYSSFAVRSRQAQGCNWTSALWGGGAPASPAPAMRVRTNSGAALRFRSSGFRHPR